VGAGSGAPGRPPSPPGPAHTGYRAPDGAARPGADASSVPDDAQKSFTQGMSDDLLDQLVAQLQTQYAVSVDQAAVAQALAQ
ncbi:peptidylprolyl isomerase, partial [Mesorhizobium sp. M1121]